MRVRVDDQVEEITLFRQINRKKTAQKVRDFLSHELDHYLAMSGKHRGDLKSPTNDGQPKGSPAGNAMENRMLNIWLAEQIIECVSKAICNCTKKSQQVLLGRYADGLLTYQIASELNLSLATFSRDQINALNEFADRFEYQLIQHKIAHEVKDLHVYFKN